MYRELLDLGVPSDDNSSNNEKNSKGILSNIVDSITGSMTPMIPALTAAGMIKVVLTLLTTFNLVESTSSSYQVINFIGDVAFYFMPFLIAANAAKVFRVNQALALIIAGVFLHPNFTAMIASQDPISLFGLPITKFSYAYSVIPVVNQALALIIAGVFLHPNFTAMIASQDPISLFGLPITKFSYAYSVIPVILMVWIMSYIEKLVDKVTPRIFKLILNPTLVILISAPIALIAVGPLGGLIGDWLAVGIDFLSSKLGFVIVGILGATFPFIVMTGMHHALTPPLGGLIGDWLAVGIDFLSSKLGFVIVGILGATFPFIVMTGMHHALTPVGLNAIATGGSDKLIFVSQVCSNIAQAGSSLAVAVKSKDKDMKQLASASGISALMGITEPALYGVTLKLKRPVVAASIAAGIGGIVGGIMQVSLYIAQNSIMAIPAFIGEAGMGNLLAGVIMIVVSFVASFILTILFGFKDINPEEKKN